MRILYLIVFACLVMASCKKEKVAEKKDAKETVLAAEKQEGTIKGVSITHLWSSDTTSLITPESVLFDEKSC